MHAFMVHYIHSTQISPPAQVPRAEAHDEEDYDVFAEDGEDLEAVAEAEAEGLEELAMPLGEEDNSWEEAMAPETPEVLDNLESYVAEEPSASMRPVLEASTEIVDSSDDEARVTPEQRPARMSILMSPPKTSPPNSRLALLKLQLQAYQQLCCSQPIWSNFDMPY